VRHEVVDCNYNNKLEIGKLFYFLFFKYAKKGIVTTDSGFLVVFYLIINKGFCVS